MTKSMGVAEVPDVRASAYYLWQVPGKPISVHLSLEVVDRMEREVIESFKAITKRGSEIGGLLLGRIAGAGELTAIVEDYEAVQCDYARGPLYLLADDDKVRMQAAIQRTKVSAEQGLSVVGFFRSNTRKDLALDDDDLALLGEFFRDPRNVCLLVKPFSMKPSLGAFFVWEEGRMHGEASPLPFPFKRSELAKGEFAKAIISGDQVVAAVAAGRPPARVDGGPTPPAPPRPEARAPAPPVIPKREEPPPPPAPPRAEARAPAPPVIPKREEPPPPPAPPRAEARAPLPLVIPKREEPPPPPPRPEARAPMPPVIPKREEPPPPPPRLETRAPMPPVIPKREEPAPPPPKPEARTPVPPAPKPEVRPAIPPVTARREEPGPPPAAPKPEVRAAAPPVTPKPEVRPPVQPVVAKREEPVPPPVVAKPDVRAPAPAAAGLREEPAPALAAKREERAVAAAPATVPEAIGEEARAARKSHRLVYLLAAVLVLLLVAVGAYLYLRPGGQRGSGVAGGPDAGSLALRVERNAGQLLLSWNREAALVKNAQRAVLTISDGDHKEDIELDLGQLRSGSISYTPITNDVSFRLQVTDKEGKSDGESLRAIAGRPSPAAPLGQAAPARSESAAESRVRPDSAPATQAASRPAVEAPPSPTPTPGGGAEPPAPAPAKPAAPAAGAPRTESLAARLSPGPSLPEPPRLEGQPSPAAIKPTETPTAAVPPPPTQLPKPAAQQPAPAGTQLPAASTPVPPPPSEPTRVGGNVRQATLVRRVDPAYPPLARQARVSGVVRVEATISRDGKILKASAVSGPPLLRQAAVDAVRQWLYKPSTLNNQPVEVVTQIDVTFNLNR